MDFPYLEKVAKLNIAALAALASAPPPPEPTVEGAVSTDTTVKWPWLVGPDFFRGRMENPYYAKGYFIHWRRTDEANWSHKKPANEASCISVLSVRINQTTIDVPTCRETLKSIRVDDWVFGVSSVSKEGFESPVASAVPGGAFKPWVAPSPAEKK
jgi:hypothetical protein